MQTPPPLRVPDGFVERLSAIGVHVDAVVLDKLGDYLARLLAMNELMNLTAIVDPLEAWEKHVLDALSLLPPLRELGAGARIADVGSGGGVPGIPLAIARPELSVTLIEATQKKAAFLVAVADALRLSRVTVRAARAETLARGELRGVFDVVTARAVGKLLALVPLAAPLVRRGGLLLLVKGQRADEELVAAKRVLAQQRIVHEKTIVTPTGRIVVLRRG
jgi:16S rRNA (guanine527-N7)-methyltransferase